MKKILGLLLATLSLSGLEANQYNCGSNGCYEDSCCPSFCDGMSIYGDYLYFRNRNCGLDYAVPYDGTLAQGSVRSVNTDWNSGFRVGVQKKCDCWNFDVSYLWYRDNNSNSWTDVNGHIAGTLVVGSNVGQGSIQYAKGTYNLDYDLVRANAAYTCCDCGCLSADIFTGFVYAHTGQHASALYSTSTDLSGTANSYDSVKQRWDMDGYGWSFGFAPVYHYNDCFDFYGVFSYSALAADFERKFSYDTTTDGGVTVNNTVRLKDDCWRLSSLIDLSVGVRYNIREMCGCNMNASIGIGYEFQQWFNTPGFLTYRAEGGEHRFDHNQNDLGFDGLVVRLNIGF